MIHYLLLFQFTLLYCVTTVLGLVVYGSDFDATAGKLYLIPLIAVPVLHRYLKGNARRLAAPKAATPILLAGAVLALLAYRPLHFGYWDEHSVSQAILLALLGLFSYLGAVVASVRLRHWQGNHQRAATASWLVLGLFWMFAVAYPMIPLLAIAMIMAVAVLWSVPFTQTLPLKQRPVVFAAGAVKYLMFLVVLDLGLTVWDYQVDSRWAWHISGAFLTAALGCWLAFTGKRRFFWPVVAIVCINFVAAILWPWYVVHPLHSALIGISLGWIAGYLLRGDTQLNPVTLLALALPLFLGLIVGYLFYANLAYAAWRAILLIPLAIVVAMSLRRPSTPSTSG